MKIDRNKTLVILAIGMLVVILIGSTYAYFVAQMDKSASRNVTVSTSTVDSLAFEIAKDLSIKANQETFASGKGNQKDETTAKATLKANNETNSASGVYNLYVDISSNDFEYTTKDKTAELILTIKKPDNTYVTSLEGYKSASVSGIQGIDVTEVKGIIPIVENKEIVATSANNNTTEEEWLITLTLINLDSNQNKNTGKTFEAKIIMEKVEVKNFANYVKSLYTTQGANGLYYHDSSLAGGANDNSYRYSDVLLGLDTVELDETLFRHIHFENVHFEPIEGINLPPISGDYDIYFYKEMAGYIFDASLYTDEQIKEMIITAFTKISSDEELSNDEQTAVIFAMYIAFHSKEVAMMDAYNTGKTTTDKISKLELNNYVCIGTDAKTCPAENLYRIVGVFDDKVKLIKNTSIGEMEWNTNDTGADWSISSLAEYLNTTFLNTLGNYGDKIAFYDWNISHTTISHTIAESASYVINTEKEQVTNYNAKIGLLYASDFAYANNIEGWEHVLSNPDIDPPYPSNWIDSAGWLLTTNGTNPFDATGSFVDTWVGYAVDTTFAVAPAFYLEPSVMIKGGTGSAVNPYRIG